MTQQVFISYANEDKALADIVCKSLEAAGIVCWYAPRDIPFAKDYEEAIVSAIASSSLLVLILSKHSNDSAHVRREVQNAFSEEPQVPVLPVRVEQVTLSGPLKYYFRSKQWLDASTPPFEDHVLTLVAYVQKFLSTNEASAPINVKPNAPDGDEAAVLPVARAETSTHTARRLSHRWLMLAAIATAALVLMLGSLYLYRPSSNPSVSAPPINVPANASATQQERPEPSLTNTPPQPKPSPTRNPGGRIGNSNKVPDAGDEIDAILHPKRPLPSPKPKTTSTPKSTP